MCRQGRNSHQDQDTQVETAAHLNSRMIPFRVKLSPLDPFKWAVVLKNPELHWIPVSFLPLKQRSRYKYWSFLPLLIYYGTGQLRLFNVFQFQGRRLPVLCRAKFHPRLPRPDTSHPWTTMNHAPLESLLFRSPWCCNVVGGECSMWACCFE